MIKRYRKPAVQLTSLLDLLFVMIFVSLLQTKNPVAEVKPEPNKETKTKQTPSPAKPTNIPLNAVFHFFKTPSNPDLPTGTFAMNGTFDTQTGALRLGGISWINQPEGYEMIPLNGKIDPASGKFTGRIEFEGCKEFTLVRTSKIPNSNIGGKWEGRYVCSQGETGLTLTIQ